ncbi:MAG: ribonuclease R [Paracoccaceae bacterium]
MKNVPSKQDILAWITENPKKASKRDVAKAFGIKGADRIDLKRILKELEKDGSLKRRQKTYFDPENLPPVSVLQVLAPDSDGDLFASPVEWQGETEPPKVLLLTSKDKTALGAGDRILARLAKVAGQEHSYEGRLIRRIGAISENVIGIFSSERDGGHVAPVDRRAKDGWRVQNGATNGAQDGELVQAELVKSRGRSGLPLVRITERLGDPSAPKSVSLIAIHQHGIPDIFPASVLQEAENATPPVLGDRKDLTGLPFITIDPADARDRDDAVFAKADTDPKNKGGHVVWVAIADVSAYVKPGSHLDTEAQKRGNSSYFPDRVVPMLPEHLSGDLCSLHEGVDRACIAVQMVFDVDGEKISHRFVRGLLRSVASLNYAEVQAAFDGAPSAKAAPLMVDIIAPLFAAFQTVSKARQKRGPLELELPERKIQLDADGTVLSVQLKERLDVHKLIEEFMILANVSAAQELTSRGQQLLFRVHEEPPREKIEMLHEVAKATGLVLAKGQVLHTRQINGLLQQASGTEFSDLINLSTLRSMTQAYYSRRNLGHFGLALASYGHFTSPIRRYADLIVHRALISAHGWGDDGLGADQNEWLDETAIAISATERRSMAAERDTTDRYLAAYLSERTDAEFTGRISGVAKFGAFVKLDETGADGLVPVRTLGQEYFTFDAGDQTLVGSDTGMKIALGLRVTVRVTQAAPETGGLILEILTLEDKAIPTQGKSHRPFGRHKSGRKGRQTTKSKRSVSRKRK